LGTDLGNFRGLNVSNAAGDVSVKYSVGETSYRGLITITASVDTAAGSVSGSAALAIVDPS
jgi:hypothetical protein